MDGFRGSGIHSVPRRVAAGGGAGSLSRKRRGRGRRGCGRGRREVGAEGGGDFALDGGEAAEEGEAGEDEVDDDGGVFAQEDAEQEEGDSFRRFAAADRPEKRQALRKQQGQEGDGRDERERKPPAAGVQEDSAHDRRDGEDVEPGGRGSGKAARGKDRRATR